jgi:hypothetical protein
MRVILPVCKGISTFSVVGAVNLHEIYQFYDEEHPSLSTECLIGKFFNIKFDPISSHADWNARLIHRDFIDIAAKSSFYLIKCWSVLVLHFGESLQCLTLSISKQDTLRLYEFPKKDDYSIQFLQVINSLKPPSLQPIFHSDQQMASFKLLFDWRDEVAKEVDTSHSNLCSDNLLGFLCRARPKSLFGLNSVYPENYKLPQKAREALLELLLEMNKTRFNEHEVLESHSETKPTLFHCIISVPNDDDCLSLCISENEFEELAENSSALMEHESSLYGNTSVKPWPPPSGLQLFPTFGVPNKIKRRNLKLNRQLRNQQRVQQGLAPIVYERNRGKADKEKKVQRQKTHLIHKYM